MWTIRRMKQRARTGVAAVELAVVAPLLIVFITGTLELARALQVKQILSDACRSAGRLAVQSTQTADQVIANANSVLQFNNLDSSQSRVLLKINGTETTSLALAREGDDISVTVSIPVSSAGYVTPIFLKSNTWISETLVLSRMRKQ